MSSILKTIFKGYLLSFILRINPDGKVLPASPEIYGPPFRAPHIFPTEIVLQIAELLDEASLLALRHTNRDLFYIISLTPDQNSRLREACNLAALGRVTATNYKNCWGFCTSCQKPQKLTSFSASEVLALERRQHASCSQHNEFWMCPHASCSYRNIRWLVGDGSSTWPFFLRVRPLRCDPFQCHFDFRHEIEERRRPQHSYICSQILVARITHYGGRGMLRDTIQSRCPKARIVEVLDSMRAPVCDHHLLSDAKVLESYDPTDIEISEIHHNVAPRPKEHERAARKSDGLCSFCQALGAQTTFRFHAKVYETTIHTDVAVIRIEVVLTRSLGACTWESRHIPNQHWRAHGMTAKKLAKFHDAWTPSKVPYQALKILW